MILGWGAQSTELMSTKQVGSLLVKSRDCADFKEESGLDRFNDKTFICTGRSDNQGGECEGDGGGNKMLACF